MTFKELIDEFQPVADRMEQQGMSLVRIANSFNSYVHAKINQEKYNKDRQTTLDTADELFGKIGG